MQKTVSVSTQTAATTIELVLDNLGPEFCAYLVLPNVVLTLANARGFADGVFYNANKTVLKQWHQEIRQLFSFLARQRSFIYVSELIRNPSGDWYASFDFLSPAGLMASLPNYSFIDKAKIDEFVRYDAMVPLVENLMNQLRQSPSLKSYKDNVDSITSGVILGYPQKAILESVKLWDKPTDKFPEQLVQANIRGADYYQCPQPIYDYPRRLVNDPGIKQHEQLWSSILQGYYTSPLHQKLTKEKAFADKIKALTEF